VLFWLAPGDADAVGALALDSAIFVVGFGAFFWFWSSPGLDCQRNGRREASAQPELRRAHC
jgi:hypothetical protein